MSKIISESFVFIGNTPCKTRYGSILPNSIRLYAIDEVGNIVKTFSKTDFYVDYKNGWIFLTENSAIPNFNNSVFFNQDFFDHTKEFCSNITFTVYADYETDMEKEVYNYSGLKLKNVIRKLKSQGEANYLVFGDSISVGCEATEGKAYFDLLKEYLESSTGGKLNITNVAICGETSSDGEKRLEEILKNDFDLVSIAYGTNDQCKLTNTSSFTDFTKFKNNIELFINSFKQKNENADIFLIAPFEVNPKWIYHSESMAVYREILKFLGRALNVAVADIYSAFELEFKNGKTPESMFRNNINHPNNYGHLVYFNVIKKLFDME